MDPRQPLPRLWLMTDERQGDSLIDAIERIPEGGGIVFRHYSLAPAARQALFEQVRQIAEARRLLLLLAGSSELAQDWGAAGSHGRGPGMGLRTASAHDCDEIREAEYADADLVFLSPVFPTRSHPGAKTLGPAQFAALAAQTRLPVVALGGMNAERFRSLDGAYGWAGIDAWATD